MHHACLRCQGGEKNAVTLTLQLQWWNGRKIQLQTHVVINNPKVCAYVVIGGALIQQGQQTGFNDSTACQYFLVRLSLVARGVNFVNDCSCMHSDVVTADRTPAACVNGYWLLHGHWQTEMQLRAKSTKEQGIFLMHRWISKILILWNIFQVLIMLYFIIIYYYYYYYSFYNQTCQ